MMASASFQHLSIVKVQSGNPEYNWWVYILSGRNSGFSLGFDGIMRDAPLDISARMARLHCDGTRVWPQVEPLDAGVVAGRVCEEVGTHVRIGATQFHGPGPRSVHESVGSTGRLHCPRSRAAQLERSVHWSAGDPACRSPV
jgi:hypothetical protein